MKLFLSIFAAAVMFGQSQTLIRVMPKQDNSATGETRYFSLYGAGQHYFSISAPDSLAADISAKWPTTAGSSSDCLSPGTGGQWAWTTCAADRTVSDYDWTQTVGALTIGGTVTLTFTGTSCPAAGTDTNYRFRLYETASPTVYETPAITGGTCTRGGAGTLTATSGAIYTNATATSASSGWQEAMFSVADSLPVHLRAGVGGYYVYSDILTEDRYATIECDGPGALLVPMVNNVSVFNAAGPGGIRVSHCGFNNVYSKTGTKAIHTYNPDGNSFGSLIYDNNISGFSTCVDLQTVYGITAYAYNRHLDCTDTALFLSNIETGDAGIGLIGPGNIFSDSVTANYGVHWNGPGNIKIQQNSFNGYIEQIHLEPKMGIVNVVGTAVTRVSGPLFRSTMAGGGFVASNTVADTVASVTDGTNLVLTSNAVNCYTCVYYIGNTGQMQIVNNTMDSWTWTTHNIRATSDLPFYNFQFTGNFFSNPNTSTYTAGISVEGAGYYFGSIKHNNLQTSYTVAEKAINISGGNYIDVGDNQIVNHLTGVAVGASAVGVTLAPNHCTNNATTTNCITSASSGTVITQTDPVTYTQLSALSAANGSRLYCSNCKQTSASSATCATGGSGANATRINGAWKCEDGSAVNAFVQGGNSFGATAQIGTNDAYGLALATGGTVQWTIQNSTGHLWAATNNTRDIGAGLSSNSPRNIYAATSMVTPKIGRDSSASLTVMTDSADRWIYTSAGMLTPAATDTYDIGNLTTPLRVRGLYGKIVDTALAGGTGDYIQTRKLQLFDNTGSSSAASYWDLNVVMSGAGAFQNSYFYLRDNAGVNVFKSERIASGGAVSRTTWYTDLLPDTNLGRSIGSTTLKFNGIWANQLGDGSNPVTVYGNNSEFNALTTQSITLNTGAATVGYVWTATSTGGAGSWQAASGAALPVVDTTGIAKGSSDATKIVRLEVDGLTTGTTRVLTVPDANMTLAGTDRAQTFTAAQTYNSTVAYAATISSGVSPTTNVAYDFGSSSLRWATAYVGGVNASVASTFAGNVTISGGSSLIMDRAARTTNQQAYWAVGGNVSTTGAWSAGTVPNGGASEFRLSHNGTAVVTLSEGGQVDLTANLVAGSSGSFGGTVTATAFNGTSTNPFRVAGTTVVDSSRNASFANLTWSGTVANSITFSAGSTYNVGSSGAPPLNVYGNYINPVTELTMGSGVVFRGSLIPATNNTDSLGNTSFRMSTVVTTNFNVSGTITAPSGSSGYSGTTTVRDSAGTGTCTLIYSGGIRTGGTC